MKTLTNICCLLLVSFSMLSFVGCTPKKVIYTSAESAINEYLKTYYTISKDDLALYKKIKANNSTNTKADWNNAIDDVSLRFKPLLTDTYYEGFIGTGNCYGRLRTASTDNYTAIVKNIKLQKFSESENKEAQIYDCTVQIIQTNLSDNKTKNVTIKEGAVALKRDGTWKISKPVKSGADDENEDAEEPIINYIHLYYRISKYDIALYKKIVTGNKDATVLAHDTNIIEGEFKGLMTTKAYENLVLSRMAYMRCKEAEEKNYYMSIKSIKLTKDSEDKATLTKIYYYDIVLTQTSISGKQVISVKDRKQITVSKINDTWKVSNAYTYGY